MVQIRFLRLFMSAPPMIALLGLALISVNPPIGFAVMLMAFILLGLFASMIVCPKCRKSPYVRVRVRDDARERTEYSAPWTEAVCSRCGHDFHGKLIS
ncbi:hypothetical protein RM53_02040 [Brevundimonas nasdae]|uniref:Uncharacterized protein n=1 Tax=Brevundimonas nasdae TaxID=172043 RepID=A0A0B4CHZ8_9CAUL|nr:hypothetical protein [Brevundimonas nasdae]KIC60884.1 hypothetical protein RM53_02040 [Brevundimonas nasdae]